MKTLIPAALAAMTLLAPLAAHAQTTTYRGNGGTGFGGILGNGSLTVSSDQTAGTITFAFNPTTGNTFNSGDVVVYLDTKTGGFADTSTFSDDDDGARQAISGFKTNNPDNGGGPSRTQVNFAPGFNADYGISFDNTGFNGVFALASGGKGSFTFVTGQNAPTSGSDTVTFNAADLGIAPGGTFTFVSSLISDSAYRSNETVGTSTTAPGTTGATPNAGFTGSTTFQSSNAYTFGTPAAAPEPGSMVPLAMGAFALGGLVIARRRTVSAK